MATFRKILDSDSEDLIKLFYVYKDKTDEEGRDKFNKIAKGLKLRSGQLLCAIGFNPAIKELTEILAILGFEGMDELTKQRNEIFINDAYKKLSLENILAIYNAAKNDSDTLHVMQYLLEQRLEKIETRIEATVNSVIIDKYKAEMRAIYQDGIAGIDFAEKRLNKIDSGFRALLNEVTIITESKLIPAGDIFFRDTILPEEKRKLLNKGLIPDELIEARLEDDRISSSERKMLNDFVKINKPGNME